MMRRFVSSLAAVMLLVHSLVGCCGRLDVCQKSCDGTECCDSLVADCCHDDHDTESQPGQTPFAPCDCRLHCKAFCVSLPPENTVVDAARAARSIELVAVAGTVPKISASAAAASRDAVSASGSWQPPLRLHLLHQIILI
jgi:hypothetical protein